jgi:hypothetical protein
MARKLVAGGPIDGPVLACFNPLWPDLNRSVAYFGF